MFFDPRVTSCYIYKHAVDCRRGHNGLTHLVIVELKKELRSGSIFLFVSRDRKTAKALKWDGSGLIVLHKKMERGRFMRFLTSDPVVEVSAEELVSIFAGAQVRLDLRI